MGNTQFMMMKNLVRLRTISRLKRFVTEHSGLMIMLGLGLAVRLFVLFNVQMDFWHDPAFTYLFAKEPLNVILGANDVHPPLYYIIFKGILAISDNELLLRGFNLIFYVLFAVFLYKLGKKVIGVKGSYYALAFLAVSPTMIYHSLNPRSYMLGMALCIMQFYVFYKNFIMNNQNTGKAIDWKIVILSVLMLHTHYFTGFLLLAEFLILLLYDKSKLNYHWNFILNGYVTAILCLPIFYYLFMTLGKMEGMWFDNIDLHSLVSTISYQFALPDYVNVWLLLFLLIVIGYYIYLVFKNRASIDMVVVFFAPVLVLFMISQISPIYHHRYFLFFAFALYLIISKVIISFNQKYQAIAYILILFALIVPLDNFVHNYEQDHLLKSVEKMKNVLPENQPVTIVHTTTFSQSPYKYYLRDWDNVDNILYTNLTKKQLFTAGGAVAHENEIVRHSDKPIYSGCRQLYLLKGNKTQVEMMNPELIYEREGLQIFKTEKVG